MAIDWSSRLFMWSSGAFLTMANLENFGIFSMSLQDGWRQPLWVTKPPHKIARHTWVCYNNHNTGRLEVGFVAGRSRDWMKNLKTRTMFQVPDGHLCLEPRSEDHDHPAFAHTGQDFDNYKWNVISESSVKGNIVSQGLWPPTRLAPIASDRRLFSSLS